MGNIVIRPFRREDRAEVRRISCQTAFLEVDLHKFFSDEEILADALTLSFTDHEPESCFVAVSDNKVIGYIIGSKNVANINRISGSKIIIPLLIKAFRRGIFWNKINLKLFFNVIRSAFKGEFVMPDFSKDFPATLHINIDKAYRGQRIGERLIETYLNFLKEQKISAVHLGTFSEGAKTFFLKQGFNILFKSKRTYLKPYIDQEINFYILGKKL
ncbi:MAG: GNAT family N-acetyltransferase [Candidatus Omnitrophica bacterium]|nr:GNAT family N-acetyltransferase [Candidatus Omnitrophota bacterium]